MQRLKRISIRIAKAASISAVALSMSAPALASGYSGWGYGGYGGYGGYTMPTYRYQMPTYGYGYGHEYRPSYSSYTPCWSCSSRPTYTQPTYYPNYARPATNSNATTDVDVDVNAQATNNILVQQQSAYGPQWANVNADADVDVGVNVNANATTNGGTSGWTQPWWR